MDGLWLFALLVVSTWVGCCHGQLHAFSVCPAGPATWWQPLVVNNLDPCELQQQLTNKGTNTVCCLFPRSITPGCGPCNQETFNIVVACVLCNDPTVSSSTPPDVSKSALAKFMKLSEFMKQTTVSSQLTLPISIVPWMNIPPDKDLFNSEAVVEAANQSQPVPSPQAVQTTSSAGTNATPLNGSPSIFITSSNSTIPSSAMNPIASKSLRGTVSSTHMTTIVASLPTSLPQDPHVVNSTTTQASQASQASPKKNVGAIAGGVIGGLAALGLISFGVFYVRRRRKSSRIPASARFMTVPEGNLADNSLPPFTQGGWSGPLAEKVVTTAELQNQYNEQRLRVY